MESNISTKAASLHLEKLFIFVVGKRAPICPLDSKLLDAISSDITHFLGVIYHNHKMRKVRGILCSKCNTLLGYAEESKRKLSRAIIYLEQYGHYEGDHNYLIELDLEDPPLIK